ncbi:MAG: glycosyltransferase [Bryobacteraceae bacterium]|jgi:glycosyltransferase involved in cell wall biosynthesis
MVILTNADGIPAAWIVASGERGTTIVAHSLGECLRQLRRCDVVLINSDPSLLFRLSAVLTALPFLRRPIVGSDIVLREPAGLWSRVTLPVRRFLLSRVDHFIHHFKDLSGYQRFFGIGPERSAFVPFKPNLRYHCDVPPNPDGEYVLCLGRSMRDFDTFLDAVERLPYPAAIARPDLTGLRAHGSRFTRPLDRLPKQVRLLGHDPNDYHSQVQLLSGARLVVVPLLKSCLVWAGTTLNAMLLGKCVILTEGPATNGLFTDEVLKVPPEDPCALAEVIDRAWRDKELRERTAAAGYRYAFELGGEPELAARLLDLVVSWYRGRAGRQTPGPGPR